MNPVTNRASKQDTIRISGKPNPPISKAVLGKMSVSHLQNIDPQKTPSKAYIKRVK